MGSRKENGWDSVLGEVGALGTEPAIDRSIILEVVRESFGLDVERVEFLTTGWASLCYRAETASGQSYMVKVYDESMPEPLLATSRDFYLPLTHQLFARGLVPQIPCPVRAQDGRFWVRAGQYVLIVSRFIEGELVGFGESGLDKLSDQLLVKLAKLVGRLHWSTGALHLTNPLTEDFRIAFEEVLPACLEALGAHRPARRAGWQGFQELLLPRRAETLGHLERLKELRAVMRRRPSRMVICHTDLHGGNLLVDSERNLYILDWEGAMLAPSEQDLFFFAGEDRFWDLFWPNYQREFGQARLDVGVLGFYYYRRGLEDLTEWLQRLLQVNQTEEQVRNALHWATETVARLSEVEATLGRIAKRLASGA